MLISTDWVYGLPNDCIKAATLISGIYDPEPARWIKVNNEIGIDLDEASLNNSMSLQPFVKCPIWLGAGGREPWPWLIKHWIILNILEKTILIPSYIYYQIIIISQLWMKYIKKMEFFLVL